MDTKATLADYYQELVERTNCHPSGRPVDLSQNDRIIYYVISTRCEMDMNGFDSVFDQLLTEDELQFLIEALVELKSPVLANLFERARSRLKAAGFFDDEATMVSDLETLDGRGLLDDVEASLRENNTLWEMDEKLVRLIPKGAT